MRTSYEDEKIEKFVKYINATKRMLENIEDTSLTNRDKQALKAKILKHVADSYTMPKPF